MIRRIALAAVALCLLAAGCGKEGTPSALVTVQVDGKSDAANLEAIAFFPDVVTVHPGDTVKFNSNFRGEPHTVALGTKIDQGMAVVDKLTPQEKQQEGPPPAAYTRLKIPSLFPEEQVEISKIKLNQAAGQPCFLDSGDAPASGPCAKRHQPVFSGRQALYNSGFLQDGEAFTVKLADDLPPGTYRFMCLVHGPEMAGKVVVVPAGTRVQTADEVRQAGRVKLNELVSKLQPGLQKANAGSPGNVQAGIDTENVPAEVTTFAPNNISIPVGGTVTWKLGFHTVSFNAPTEATPDIQRAADGSVQLNQKTFTPALSPVTHPPAGGPSSDSKGPPPPTTVDAGKWDGSGFHSSGAIEAPGDVFYKVTFTKPGTYPYVCLIHVDMKGTVTVR